MNPAPSHLTAGEGQDVSDGRSLPVQFGSAAAADFESNTWTFEMQGGHRVAAGPFAILPRKSYEELVAALDALEMYARGFSVSGVYLADEVEGARLLTLARAALAKVSA